MNKEWFLDVIRSKEFYVPIITIMFSILIVSATARIVKKLFNDDVHDFGAKRRRTVVILINNIIRGHVKERFPNFCQVMIPELRE